MAGYTLEKEPKTVGQVQKEAAMAQRVLLDEVFVGFIQEMQDDAAHAALFQDTVDLREQARIKVLTVAELKGRLAVAAKLPEELRENEERARSFE